MNHILRGVWILFWQLAASLACFMALYFVGGVFLSLFWVGTGTCYVWNGHEIFANLVAEGAALYFSLRIGFYWAHPARPTTKGDLRFFARVAASLLTLWFAVFFGALDIALFPMAAIRDSGSYLDDLPSDITWLTWVRATLGLLVGLVVVVSLARWCVGPAHFRIR